MWRQQDTVRETPKYKCDVSFQVDKEKEREGMGVKGREKKMEEIKKRGKWRKRKGDNKRNVQTIGFSLNP